MSDEYRILRGDCLDRMGELEDGSVDAIVTDPPYGLEFMGKDWDNNVPGVAYWSEALRVAKPGAHLLCFGGTRTFHRMACAIEDAGWEIRDCIMWVYGSGFPKSMDVSKAIDKALGAKREKVDGGKGPAYQRSIGNTRPWMFEENHQIDGPVPATAAAAAAWDGWGTCLKPAWEPIIVARKPLDGTVAHNVMTYGTGAINIDGCRVGTEEITTRGGDKFPKLYGTFNTCDETKHIGRFPANLVHDGSDEVLALFPDSNCGKNGHTLHHTDGHRNSFGAFNNQEGVVTYRHGGNGSAARFFYCAKASKADRGEGNDHPTVKPNALMRWLVRLVCPQGGTVLDPFMGSGSTGVAAMDEAMLFVGIDKDEHYCDVAEQRIRRELDGGIQRSMF